MLRESLLTNACIPLVLQYFFSSSLCMLCMVQLPRFCTFLAVLVQLMVYFLYPCLMQGSKNVALFVFSVWHGLVTFGVCQCKISTSSHWPIQANIEHIGNTMYLPIGPKGIEIKSMGTFHLWWLLPFQKKKTTACWMPMHDTGMQLTNWVFVLKETSPLKL